MYFNNLVISGAGDLLIYKYKIYPAFTLQDNAQYKRFWDFQLVHVVSFFDNAFERIQLFKIIKQAKADTKCCVFLGEVRFQLCYNSIKDPILSDESELPC
jgi:hypothetical protein